MYKLIPLSTSIKRLSDGAIIPDNPTLGEWQDYQDWKKKGNTPEPYLEEPPTPVTEIDAYKFKLALNELDLFVLVETAIKSLTGKKGREASIKWQDAKVYRLNDPLMEQIRLAINKTPEELQAVINLALTYP